MRGLKGQAGLQSCQATRGLMGTAAKPAAAAKAVTLQPMDADTRPNNMTGARQARTMTMTMIFRTIRDANEIYGFRLSNYLFTY